MTDGIGFLTPDADGSAPIVCRRLALPSFLWAYFNGAFGQLLEIENWVEFGSATIEDVVRSFQDAFDDMRECALIGSIVSYIRQDLPSGVLPCNGSVYQVADYPLLAAVLPALFIVGDGTFVTPNIDGRFIVGEGNGRIMLDIGGEESHALTIDEMPTHSHNYTSSLASLTTVVIPDEPSAIPSPSITSPEGGGQAHNNMPPFYTVKYGIVAR